MALKKHVFLLGMPATGKSFWAKILGKAFNTSILDTDQIFETRNGCTIETFWNDFGQFDFRVQERQILFELFSRPPSIVATGGGMPCFFDNLYWMKQCDTVFLQLSPEELYKRSCLAPRPLFNQGLDYENFLEFYFKRLTWYQKAHFHWHSNESEDSTVNFFGKHFFV